jgi:hypothetical protein
VKRRGAWLGSLLIGRLSAVAATNHASAWQPQDPSVVTSSAYGDTVWFDSPVMSAGHAVIPATTPVDSLLLRGRSAIAWARTPGTPVLILLDERRPMPATKAIVDSILRDPRLGLHPGDSLGVWRMVAREAGRFDSIDGRPMYGWEIYSPPEDSSSDRLIFVVIGLSDSSVAAPLHQAWQEPWGRTRSPGDPMPIRVDQHLRPFEIPVADRLSTARIVGEFRADLKHRRIERIVAPPVMEH